MHPPPCAAACAVQRRVNCAGSRQRAHSQPHNVTVLNRGGGMTAELIPALFIVAGLVNSAAAAGPVPPHETATAQLRAINHRFLNTRTDPAGSVIDTLTHENFVF